MTRLAVVFVVALVSLGSATAPAGAKLKLPLLTPPPPPPPVIAPVAEKLTRDPATGVVRGTVILVHAGGWAGHDANAQRLLFDERPGDLFVQRGWRVVSVDYDEGTAGLQDVLDATGAELARGSAPGPVCIYGESSGAHLALVAASRLRSIDCVIALGTPTDIPLYESEGTTSDNGQVRYVATRMARFFGTTPEVYGPWNPVTLAPSIRADVLLVNEADDPYVSALHAQRFEAARPTTQAVVLEAGDPADPSALFVHGAVSAAGRASYDTAIGAFADRMVAANDAEREAAVLGCPRVGRTLAEVGLATIQASLRCLARRDTAARRKDAARHRRTSIRLRGEIDAARIWARLRTTTSGRRALAAAAKGRVRLAVAVSDRSQVTLRSPR